MWLGQQKGKRSGESDLPTLEFPDGEKKNSSCVTVETVTGLVCSPLIVSRQSLLQEIDSETRLTVIRDSSVWRGTLQRNLFSQPSKLKPTANQQPCVSLMDGLFLNLLHQPLFGCSQVTDQIKTKQKNKRVKTGFRHPRQEGPGFVHPLVVRKHTANPVNQCVEPQGSQQGGGLVFFFFFFLFILSLTFDQPIKYENKGINLLDKALLTSLCILLPCFPGGSKVKLDADDGESHPQFSPNRKKIRRGNLNRTPGRPAFQPQKRIYKSEELDSIVPFSADSCGVNGVALKKILGY